MARLARVVVPGVPHHVTQRGNRRQPVFFRAGDYAEYLRLLREWCDKEKVEVWAYCLMPNHVHLIAVPGKADGLARALGEAHRRYTRMVNFRKDWRGYLWQGRFASFPLDDDYLFRAARYVELNPVRAKLVKRPEDYRWSSARAHLNKEPDPLLSANRLQADTKDWQAYLRQRLSESEIDELRQHSRTGRPLGSRKFIARLEKRLLRPLLPQKTGPKGPHRRTRRKLR